LRSLGARDAHKLEATRRLVKRSITCARAGDIDISDQDGAYAAYLSIPKSPAKRFRYAYCFLLRRCVEADHEYRLVRRMPARRSGCRDRALSCGGRAQPRVRQRDDAAEFVAASSRGTSEWQQMHARPMIGSATSS